MTRSAASPARLELWRAVEGQHVAATMVLVDTRLEQELLEGLLDAAKPPVPAEAARLHYLLATPFRYPPTAYGSRFRRPGDPGVFYGADAVRTACAELGYWRWRFLLDSPALERIDPVPQTVFKVPVAGPAIDLRAAPWSRDRARWTDSRDYSACQELAAKARDDGIAIIRYQSVRDPEAGGAAAVLEPSAFAARAPRALETWYLTVTRERVRWLPAEATSRRASFEFDATHWDPGTGPRPTPQ